MYGIIGYPLLSTFSPGYFKEKFRQLHIDDTYEKFPLEKVEDLKELLKQHSMKGMNVTIPYKQEIIPLLDALDETARAIGAVNTIQFKAGHLIGYNTDAIGFHDSLKPLLKEHHTSALILGTGGASKAVGYVLKQLHIPFQYVSRTSKGNVLAYSHLDEAAIAKHMLIINTTPLGMKPYEGLFPDIPYYSIGTRHLLYDLIYTPPETPFLIKGKAQGATIKNGYEMLIGQAEASWKIWNEA